MLSNRARVVMALTTGAVVGFVVAYVCGIHRKTKLRRSLAASHT